MQNVEAERYDSSSEQDPDEIVLVTEIDSPCLLGVNVDLCNEDDGNGGIINRKIVETEKVATRCV